jgi:predicted esterase/photosystem II stability/assembly factor-like uncharacterized protein
VKRSALLFFAIGCGAGDGDDPILPDAPPNLCAHIGGAHDQTLALGDGVEDRYYFLYVPPGIDCSAPVGLLIDFHGTAGDPRPEEAYANEHLTALADQYEFILARPRSRSSVVNGTRYYQWDINTGDLARNQKFGKKLVDELAQRFPIDRARVYASGFSSGSNMASEFLFDPASPFKGVAPMAGGHWFVDGLPPLDAGPRMYLATGYRDYLWPTTRELAAGLADAGLPADRLFVRRSNGGHELYPYYFEEAWRFFDLGERPASGGALAAPWVAESIAETADINALVVDSGTLVAASARGRLWRNEAAGWTKDREQPAADYVAACFNGTRGFVGGSYAGAVRATVEWSDVTTLPDYGMLGAAWINGADCRPDGSIVVVGYWSATISTDGGASWSRFNAATGFGVDAQMASAATSPGGATVIAGYHYLGRAPSGSTTAVRTSSMGGGWWNAVTALPNGRFWAVGDGGIIATSGDDGRSWTMQQSGTAMDLYAVHFVDTQTGAAVGRNGTILVTNNGGMTWTKRPLGRASYVGAVHVDATHIWIAGEDGLLARSPR